LRLPVTEVKSAILSHDEFAAFKAGVIGVFDQWRTTNTPRLKGFNKEGHPKKLIVTIAEALLKAFREAKLLDAYDIYQHLMDYWAETMQDDCYLIAADGWLAETHPVLEEVKSGKKKGEMKDKGWACDLIPKPYIVVRYFAREQRKLDVLQGELDAVGVSLTELVEKHGGDEGILKDVSTKGDAQEAYTQAIIALWNEEDKAACDTYTDLINQAKEYTAQLRSLTDHHHISVLKNNKGNFTLKAVKDRLAAISDKDEIATLTSYLEADQEQKVKIKEADAALDKLAYERYPQLSVEEIKTLVVDDKWMSTLAKAVQGELDRVSQMLTGRIRQLAERYAEPLPKLVYKVAELSARVDEHLKKMGTGKTRLPGFEGKWEVKRLGDHVKFLRNGVNSRAELTLDDPVKYLHYGDIHGCAATMLDPVALPSLPSDKAKTLDRLCDGDLVFADASEDLEGVGKSVEICGVTGMELVSGLHTIAARFDKNIIADGFKAYLQFCPTFSIQLRRLSAGTKVYATNRSHVASIEMRLPSVEEQQIIATVLSDMDAEIEALEQRRAKTRDLKQAMMQELLTGKTRLVNVETSV